MKKQARVACHPSYRGAPLRKCSKGYFRALSAWREGALGSKDKDKGKDAMCFLKGTKIQMAEGERKVEDLAIGDLLPTMFGGLRPVQ